MLLIISILSFIFGVMKKQSNIVSFLLLLLLWILFGFSFDHADYTQYLIGFYKTEEEGFYGLEIGYQLLNKSFHFWGVEFQTFLKVVSLFFLVFLYRATDLFIQKYSAFIFSLYLLFPFTIDIVQIRNFISMTILIYAVRFLLVSSKYANIKFIFYILVASSFHYSALFYLFFLLTRFNNKRKMFLFVLVGLGLGMIMVYSGIISFIFEQIFTAKKYSLWFKPKMRFGLLLLFTIHLVATFLVNYSYTKIRNKYLHTNKVSTLNFKIAELIHKINIIMFLLFPLYAFNIEFFRIYRNLFFLFYILFALVLELKLVNGKEKQVFLGFIYFFIISLLLYFIVIPFYDTVFYPIFYKNILFN